MALQRLLAVFVAVLALGAGGSDRPWTAVHECTGTVKAGGLIWGRAEALGGRGR